MFWLLYLPEFAAAAALAVIALALMGLVAGRVHLVTVDSPLDGCPGHYVTEYVVVVGKTDAVRSEVAEWKRKEMEGERRG